MLVEPVASIEAQLEPGLETDVADGDDVDDDIDVISHKNNSLDNSQIA